MKPYFFKLAQRESYKSTSRFRLGAVVVDKRKNVLGVGFNQMERTHPKARFSNEKYPFLHAELSALLGLKHEETQGGSVYVFRQKKDGTMGNAKPCPGCMQALKDMGIRRVYFSDENGYKEEEVA